MKKIKFIPQSELAQEIVSPPLPAKNFIPDWYKKLPRKMNKDLLWIMPNGGGNLTIKACVPTLDALTSGYMITLSADIYVTQDPRYDGRILWNSTRSIVSHHTELQYGDMVPPEGYERNPFKWNTDWIIRTPRKYSLLFIHPHYRFDLPFITLPGLVDTDKYGIALNLPFFLKEGFEGLIPKGTPIAQVIPIKRERWIHSLLNYGKVGKYNRDKIRDTLEREYKKTNWEKKEYL
jgi:hypothetical protein